MHAYNLRLLKPPATRNVSTVTCHVSLLGCHSLSGWPLRNYATPAAPRHRRHLRFSLVLSCNAPRCSAPVLLYFVFSFVPRKGSGFLPLALFCGKPGSMPALPCRGATLLWALRPVASLVRMRSGCAYKCVLSVPLQFVCGGSNEGIVGRIPLCLMAV